MTLTAEPDTTPGTPGAARPKGLSPDKRIIRLVASVR
jgi:hypothetical protein